MLQKLETQILELYGDADQAVIAYQQISNLACPGGCIQCCYSEKVEATVLEMIPAAFHLFATNQAELIFKRIEKQGHSKQCILFRPDLNYPDGGGCTLYLFRPLVCRLFGFAGNNDRHGLPQLAQCRDMVAPEPRTAGSEGMPLFHAFGLTLTTIHPHLGTARKPINNALYEALAKVGLILDLESIPAAIIELDLPPDAPATTPTKPHRKAA